MPDIPSKINVKKHWETESPGSRYGDSRNRIEYFREISNTRYRLEPYIPAFAEFDKAHGKRILEIGVGTGADLERFSRTAHHVTGVDLTENAIALTLERFALEGVSKEKYTLQVADAERLPFENASFDWVHSWGVLHHTPDTMKAFSEVYRVLKPGGRITAMVYHVPSVSGFLMWCQNVIERGEFSKSAKEVIYTRVQGPGAKAYTLQEAGAFLREIGFEPIILSTKLGPSDLLDIRPSHKYRSWVFRAIFALYPGWLIRFFIGHRLGLYLLIRAEKPRG